MSEHRVEARQLSSSERRQIVAIETATSLAALADRLGTDDERDAYVQAKQTWKSLRSRDPASLPEEAGLPGVHVTVDGTTYWVHGITHADTDAERSAVRDAVRRWTDDDEGVYCEQGVRSMYLDDVDVAREMDDYRWAIRSCRTASDGAGGLHGGNDDGVDVEQFRSTLRETAFSLAESTERALGGRVAHSIGDLACSLLTSHESLGTAEDYTSHTLSSRASRDPSLLPRLQHYYESSFLPQPLEREWLRRHDRELELATHARNERMADYAVYHVEDEPAVHLLVGAAHQPGVRYYLERHRDGERTVEGFELC